VTVSKQKMMKLVSRFKSTAWLAYRLRKTLKCEYSTQ